MPRSRRLRGKNCIGKVKTATVPRLIPVTGSLPKSARVTFSIARRDYCEKGLKQGSLSRSHRDNTVRWLNDLCAYCGAMPVPQLKKGHVTQWIDSHSSWRSSETRRGVISVVLAAFNRAQNLFDVRNPLKGLKKPRPQPRLTSISSEDEQALYDACEPRFREFLGREFSYRKQCMVESSSFIRTYRSGHLCRIPGRYFRKQT